MVLDNDMLGQIIRRYEGAHFAVHRRLTAMFRDLMPEELTFEQSATIRYLRTVETCTSTELADVFCVGKSSITAIITRLFDKQLLERLPDEKDRRVTLLRLTEEGKRTADAVELQIQEVIAKYMQHFDEQEALAFIETYEKLALVMSQPPGDGEEQERE
ncbi:MarR family winged helix-turn-helix transcriptional regulator [Paenibacillus glycanilyticus]|uniref:MarR family transcriptional regulator n=1 Tax=Paenibacillus glycanilyticus TaxID=126569 RepID=A0ABQ6GL04_9BACL|nr:MarR family transcriptional regulator [Paenibacillus glycanilyticus]GLX70038.1 MarR family transcriptional regulator [Paenibacillus glycanilyticus]